MDEFYIPPKKHGYVRMPRPLTSREQAWLAVREHIVQSGGSYYCYWCRFSSVDENGDVQCSAASCPTDRTVESLSDGETFMRLVLEDIRAGEEHDKPCSHVPRKFGCPYQTDENGDWPCYWCEHKELLIRIDEAMGV